MRNLALIFRVLVLTAVLTTMLWLAPLFWFDLWSQWASLPSLATALSVAVVIGCTLGLLTRWPLTHWVDQREQGVVKWFNGTKGFGFITRSNDEDVFVHFRSIRGRGHRTLHEGQQVRFSVVISEKGLQAEDVSVLRQD